jgi:hypothetical protein
MDSFPMLHEDNGMEEYPVQKGFVTLKGRAITISEKSLLQTALKSAVCGIEILKIAVSSSQGYVIAACISQDVAACMPQSRVAGEADRNVYACNVVKVIDLEPDQSFTFNFELSAFSTEF